MKALPAIAWLMAAVGLNAQTLPTAATSIRSASGQFQVVGVPPDAFPSAATLATNANVISLQPSLVAVSTERIKQAVWRELEYDGDWQNRTLVTLRPARTLEDSVFIVTERANAGWNYLVQMPEILPRERYLRAMVQVVLSELANRRAGAEPVEVPVWLTEGLAFHLLCNKGSELLLGTPRYYDNGVALERTLVEYRRWSELEKAHKILIGDSPLTFEELSWPRSEQLQGPEGDKYRASAQLLTCKLLKLHGGTECMQNFIAALPDYLNWQMAFLHGFEPHFKRPLDIEKWWALEATDFAGRDLTQTWPYEESWSKLAAALVEPVDVFANTNELPTRSEVSLQTVVRDWSEASQKTVLRRKSAELAALRPRIAPELIQLTTGYAEAIDLYLRELDTLKSPTPNSHITTGSTRLAEYKLLNRLAGLDAELKRLQPRASQRSAPNDNATTGTLQEMRLPETKLRAN